MRYQKYIGAMILDSRRDTQNAADIPTTTSQRGIQTRDFLRYFNHAQNAIEAAITEKYPFLYQSTVTIATNTTTSEYSIPDEIYAGTRIKTVEYSDSNENGTFRPLEFSEQDQYYTNNAEPRFWRRNNSSIVIFPTPSASGFLKITYQRKLDTLALRAGQILSRTISNGNVTALSIYTPALEPQDITDGLDDDRVMCVTSRDGVVKAYNIPFSDYFSATGIFTITSTPHIAGLPPAVNDFITIGRNTTTHSKLHDIAREGIMEYVNRRIKIRESSPSEVQMLDTIAQRAAKQIISTYALGDSTTVKHIPMTSFGENMLRWNRR